MTPDCMIFATICHCRVSNTSDRHKETPAIGSRRSLWLIDLSTPKPVGALGMVLLKVTLSTQVEGHIGEDAETASPITAAV